MNILGISFLSHDSSAAIIVDGKVVAMVEEERCSRVKHDNGFPYKAISFVLNEAGLTSKDIDIVTVPYKFFLGLGRRIAYGLKKFTRAGSFLPRNIGWELINYLSFKKGLRGQFDLHGIPLSPNCQLQMYEHHLSHVASAHLASPFEDSLIISWDGRGEWPCIVYALGKGQQVNIIHRHYFPNSIGQVYQALSQYIGFSDLGDEYKVMGLAAYGAPTYIDTFRDFIQVNGWRIRINQHYMNYHIYNRFMADRYSVHLQDYLGPPRSEDEPILQRHKDIACSIQTRVNEVGVEVARALRKEFKFNKLCLTGGVAQNIIMNQQIYQKADFDEVFVQPASHDAGLSIGSALLASVNSGDMKDRFVMKSTAWGPSFSSIEVEAELKNYNLSYVKPEDICLTTSRMLADGKVVGWFSGKTEFGPRALGYRSILADARLPEMKDIVNSKIKFRESFRPFAPSVLAESFYDYFDLAPINPFMTFYASVKPKKLGTIPAVIHVDDSARPQAVFRNENPKYWQLIKNFEKQTGIPIILNTSFNVKGEPIVNSPSDALRCFFSTGLDYLIIEDFVVVKRDTAEIKQYL
jgi:carbamoyltransferase